MTDYEPEQLPAKFAPDPNVIARRRAEIFAMIDIDRLAECCEALRYSAEDELRTLVNIASNDENPKLQLAAIKIIQQRKMEALKAAGMITTATSTTIGPDGSKHTLSTNMVAGALQTVQTFPVTRKEIIDVQGKEHTTKESASGDPSDCGISRGGPQPIVDKCPQQSEHLPGLSGPTGESRK